MFLFFPFGLYTDEVNQMTCNADLYFIIISIIISISYVITSRRSKPMPSRTVRTTLALPADLLAAVDQAVQAGKARSRNELVRMALERELAAQKRAAIDAAFAGMADDPAYQSEAEAIADEFAQADWEAWQQAAGKR
jgi:Arc/MetJ-type ribon-helix-helix transcriptional regulator